MKAAATIKTASGTKATADMETAASATVKTTATAVARLGYFCEREPHDRASQDCSERQRDLFAAPHSQHIFLHLN
jgi:hypothetical protein